MGTGRTRCISYELSFFLLLIVEQQDKTMSIEATIAYLKSSPERPKGVSFHRNSDKEHITHTLRYLCEHARTTNIACMSFSGVALTTLQCKLLQVFLTKNTSLCTLEFVGTCDAQSALTHVALALRVNRTLRRLSVAATAVDEHYREGADAKLIDALRMNSKRPVDSHWSIFYEDIDDETNDFPAFQTDASSKK